jgi:hypothetical protein
VTTLGDSLYTNEEIQKLGRQEMYYELQLLESTTKAEAIG